MTLEIITRHWALVIASVLGVGILMFVLYRLYEASPRGRLNSNLRILRARKLGERQAQRRLDKASERLARLQSRTASTKPRLVAEAGEALQDAQSLQKIAADQVLVAKNHLRNVILEEFPPNRQDGLRNKYL